MNGNDLDGAVLDEESRDNRRDYCASCDIIEDRDAGGVMSLG
jgi:hypothetical protein